VAIALTFCCRLFPRMMSAIADLFPLVGPPSGNIISRRFVRLYICTFVARILGDQITYIASV
jgi:hypothetical protein